MTVISKLTPFRIPDAAAAEKECFTVPWSAGSLREELNSPFANYFYVTVDGEESIPLPSNATLMIRRAEQSVRLLQLRRDSFYQRLRRKLSDRR